MDDLMSNQNQPTLPRNPGTRRWASLGRLAALACALCVVGCSQPPKAAPTSPTSPASPPAASRLHALAMPEQCVEAPVDEPICTAPTP
jgi:hypothetical protein